MFPGHAASASAMRPRLMKLPRFDGIWKAILVDQMVMANQPNPPSPLTYRPSEIHPGRLTA